MAIEADDELLRYYMAELDYLTHEGDAFAQRFPKAAQRLQRGADGSADPQVDRLVESFAFLTARLQRNLDAGWPEVPEAILGLLYPHLVAPVPSMAIAQFTADPDHPRPAEGDVVPRGSTLLTTAAGEDADYNTLTCRFQTVYPVTIWPLAVTEATLDDAIKYILPAGCEEIETVLRLKVSCTGAHGFDTFGAAPKSLRFHLHADDRHMLTERRTVLRLYDLLFNHVGRVLVRTEGETGFSASLDPKTAIRPVGLAPDEAALPHPPEAHQGYRLLQEYFTFPDKFLFFDLAGLPALGAGRSVELLFLLDRREKLTIKPGLFRLGCTPIVNLFRRTSEPIRIEPTQYEYRLVPDSRWERATEIHTVLKLSTTAVPDSERGVIEPYFAFTHAAARQGQRARWIARRRPVNRTDLTGTEILLAFHHDHEFTAENPAAPVLFAHTLCTNRGVASQILPGTVFDIESDVPVLPDGIRCLGQPTRQLAPPLGGQTLWRLVSHLSLNHRSLVEGPNGIEALQEILRLYAHAEDPAIDGQISALAAVSTRKIVGRVGADAWRGFCRGTEITLDYDPDGFTAASASPFLLGQVLSQFFGLYATINSFTQLVMRASRRGAAEMRYDAQANGEPLRHWPTRRGETVSA
jgi:type VI secretion system protein ImpG